MHFKTLKGSTEININKQYYCRSGNIREKIIFANIRELVASWIQSSHQYRITLNFIEYIDTHSRFQELAYSE